MPLIYSLTKEQLCDLSAMQQSVTTYLHFNASKLISSILIIIVLAIYIGVLVYYHVIIYFWCIIIILYQYFLADFVVHVLKTVYTFGSNFYFQPILCIIPKYCLKLTIVIIIIMSVTPKYLLIILCSH